VGKRGGGKVFCYAGTAGQKNYGTVLKGRNRIIRYSLRDCVKNWNRKKSESATPYKGGQKTAWADGRKFLHPSQVVNWKEGLKVHRRKPKTRSSLMKEVGKDREGAKEKGLEERAKVRRGKKGKN